MPDDLQTIAQTIVKRSMVNRPHERLFCLGPNVGRISFLSQQIRALNLIWALRRQDRIKPNSLIAVIGAGVSGVTAAIALRAYGCTVRLYDHGARPLHRQREVTHRQIYPNINFWPGERILESTTALPFLDWHLGQCDEVMKTLELDWKKLLQESGDDLKFIGNVHIRAADPNRSHENRLVVKSRDEEWSDFDAVVVASGFGEERPHLDFKIDSYWKGDELESYRDGVKKKLPVIVSGFGDGGHIDALRVAYDFDYGRLSFSIAKALDPTPIPDEIAEIEQKFGERNWLAKSLDYEEVAKTIRDDDEYSEVRDLIESELHQKNRLVIMVDKNLDHPYASAAAPVHKLLVAYAFIRSTLDYIKGEIERPEDDDDVFLIGSEVFRKSENHVVIRHGAKEFGGQLISTQEWEDLRQSQQDSMSFSFKPAWNQSSDPYSVPDGWACRDRDAERYIEERISLAQDALIRMGSKGRVMSATDRFIILNHEMAFQPTNLFGKSVEYKSLDQVKLAELLE